LRINAIYEARRGKKRVKRLSQSTESNSGKGRLLWLTLLGLSSSLESEDVPPRDCIFPCFPQFAKEKAMAASFLLFSLGQRARSQLSGTCSGSLCLAYHQVS
jgi:hypothetical protein